MLRLRSQYNLFFFNDSATTEIYTLSLHDALPISHLRRRLTVCDRVCDGGPRHRDDSRSEEHTSELQSQSNLVCRLLLEKKKRDSDSLVRVFPSSTNPGCRASAGRGVAV